MRTNIAELLFTVTGLLTPDECRWLIDRGEGLGFEPASVAMASGPRMMTRHARRARPAARGCRSRKDRPPRSAMV